MRIGETIKITKAPQRNNQKVKKPEKPVPVKLPDKVKTNAISN